MVELTKWKNQEIGRMRRDMDRLFNRMWQDFCVSSRPSGLMAEPSIDMDETEDTLHITADLPGIDPEDLKVSVTHDTLIIRGEKKAKSVQENSRLHRVERHYGSFSRSIRLPCLVNLDEIKAIYEDGILHINMPKLGPGEMRGIEVQSK